MTSFFKKQFQKPFAVTMIFLLVFSSSGPLSFFFLIPKKAEAFWGVGDWNASEDATEKMKQTNKILETAKDIAITYFRKKLLDKIVDEIIRWINGEGDPSFITDYKGFMKDLTDEAAGEFLNKITGMNLCESSWGAKIKISLSKPKTFYKRYECTLSKIGTNFKKFTKDFRNGGWRGWISVTQDQNNPYGFYLAALDEKVKITFAKQKAAELKILAGSGFKGDEVCVQRKCWTISGVGIGIETGEWKMSEANTYDEEKDKQCECTKSDIKTPGDTQSKTMGEAVWKDVKWLEKNQEWKGYVVAITDAMINRLVTEGVKKLTTKCSGVPDETDEEIKANAPQTKLSILDAWNADINILSSGVYTEQTTTSYADECRKQRRDWSWIKDFFFVPWKQIGKALKRISSRLTQAASGGFSFSGGKVKFSTDVLTGKAMIDDFKYAMKLYKEAIEERSKEKEKHSRKTLAATGSINKIPDTSTSSVIVLYTLDGSEPADYSGSTFVYSGPFTVAVPTTLKWKGINDEGYQEAIHTEYLSPPFFKGELKTAAVPVDPNSLALISNMPATIYYTVDGSVPTATSSRYIKKIDLSTEGGYAYEKTVQWFGVDSGANQEQIQSALAVIPFLQAEIVDLVQPTAIIRPVNSPINLAQFFELNPFSSFDNDSTSRLVMYEWDLDEDGAFDWYALDYNRDGLLDEYRFNNGAVSSSCVGGNMTGSGSIGNIEVSCPTPVIPGRISARYFSSGGKTITLRVTDDEGLYSTASVVIDVQ